jgi:cytochrome c oxidase assembly factor CtaG
MGQPLVMLLRAARVAPVIVWSLHTVTVWAWHLPAAYLAAARHPVVHAAEHVSFLLTAMLLWWVVLRPEPGRSPRYATGLVLMLATSLQVLRSARCCSSRRSPGMSSRRRPP